MVVLTLYCYVDNIQVGYPGDVKSGNEIAGSPAVGSACKMSWSNCYYEQDRL